MISVPPPQASNPQPPKEGSPMEPPTVSKPHSVWDPSPPFLLPPTPRRIPIGPREPPPSNGICAPPQASNPQPPRGVPYGTPHLIQSGTPPTFSSAPFLPPPQEDPLGPPHSPPPPTHSPMGTGGGTGSTKAAFAFTGRGVLGPFTITWPGKMGGGPWSAPQIPRETPDPPPPQSHQEAQKTPPPHQGPLSGLP